MKRAPAAAPKPAPIRKERTIVFAELPPGQLPEAAGFLGSLERLELAPGSGSPVPISAARVRKFCTSTQVSIAALDATGFVRPCSLDEGLARTVARIRADHS